MSNCQSGISKIFSFDDFEKLFKDHLCWGDTKELKSFNRRLFREIN